MSMNRLPPYISNKLSPPLDMVEIARQAAPKGFLRIKIGRFDETRKHYIYGDPKPHHPFIYEYIDMHTEVAGLTLNILNKRIKETLQLYFKRKDISYIYFDLEVHKKKWNEHVGYITLWEGSFRNYKKECRRIECEKAIGPVNHFIVHRRDDNSNYIIQGDNFHRVMISIVNDMQTENRSGFYIVEAKFKNSDKLREIWYGDEWSLGQYLSETGTNHTRNGFLLQFSDCPFTLIGSQSVKNNDNDPSDHDHSNPRSQLSK